MSPPSGSNIPPAKRRKLDDKARDEPEATGVTSASLSRAVSPPVSRRKLPTSASTSLLVPEPTWGFSDVPKQILTPPPAQPPPSSKQANQSATEQNEEREQRKNDGVAGNDTRRVASPFQLTKVRDLALHQNVDTVELKDILGDPLIKECWNFNFLFDLDFVMQQFDEDVRDLIKVKIIHGFWKRDDERRIAMMEMAERYPNMKLISAYLPDPFGTHHSKMLILFRHDDRAQIVIHTANMISKDWTNMTQAVWKSPLLRLTQDLDPSTGPHAIGSGSRFHIDLRRYLLSYEKRLQRLVDQLAEYDFSEIKAAFLGSAPSRQVVNTADPSLQTSFGWLGLHEILSNVPITSQRDSRRRPHIVLQLSSIATLGAAPTWLSHFQSLLSRSCTLQPFDNASKARFNIIFPMAEEVRTSLNGYESGGSIHIKLQSAQQQKQLQYLHPLLCHWKHPSSLNPTTAEEPKREAHRGPAAPHIKTYIRFTDDTHKSIDWALLTSANLSKQAWGDVANKQGEVRIQSYETGVLVWPELFARREQGCGVDMVPTFGKDIPDIDHTTMEPPQHEQHIGGVREDDDDDEETEDEHQDHVEDDEETEDERDGFCCQSNAEQGKAAQSTAEQSKGKERVPLPNINKKRIIVGLRMPYDLPLSSYGAKDVPWCASQRYTEPDWKGRAWGGFQPR